MFALLLPIVACVVFGVDQPLIVSARLDSEGEAWPAALTPDGKSLLSVLKSGDQLDVAVWDTASKSRTFLLKRRVGLPLAVSPDRQCVAGMVQSSATDSTEDVEIVIWDVAKRSSTNLLKLKKTSILSLWPAWSCQSTVFSNDSTQFAIADGNTKKGHVWRRSETGDWGDPKTLNLAQRADLPKPALLEIHFKRDGTQLFVFFPISKADEPPIGAELWDIASGRAAECRIPSAKEFIFYTGPFPHILGENTVCFQAPEGSGKGVVGIDVSSGKEKYHVYASTLWARLSPDGKTCADLGWLLMSHQDMRPVTVRFWNFDDGAQLRTLELPKSDQPPIAVFTPDSRFFLCTAGPGGRRVFLIDVKSGKIRSSWTSGAPLRGMFPLSTGEIAVIGVEPKAILLSKIRIRE
jgi:hypothetical protein